MTDYTNTALDSIEAALLHWVKHSQHPCQLTDEALALIPALRDMLKNQEKTNMFAGHVKGSNMQEALAAVEKMVSFFAIADDETFCDEFKTIRKALQKPQAVDVEGLKRYTSNMQPSPTHNAAVNGWNDCIDHLREKGYLTQPTEDKTS